MSVHASSAVWRMRGLSPVEKLVLLKLADHADDSGANAYPSVARIADEVGCSERTVQRTLKELVERGFAVIQEEATRYQPRCYRVVLDRGVNLSPLRGDNGDASGVTNTAARGDTAMAPKPSYQPSKEPSNSPKRGRAKAPMVRISDAEIQRLAADFPDFDVGFELENARNIREWETRYSSEYLALRNRLRLKREDRERRNPNAARRPTNRQPSTRLDGLKSLGILDSA